LASDSGVLLKVKVVPNASRTELAGWLDDGCLKVKLQAPPEEGKANKALILLLAKTFGLARNQVNIVKGTKSRRKVIELKGLDDKAIQKTVGS